MRPSSVARTLILAILNFRRMRNWFLLLINWPTSGFLLWLQKQSKTPGQDTVDRMRAWDKSSSNFTPHTPWDLATLQGAWRRFTNLTLAQKLAASSPARGPCQSSHKQLGVELILEPNGQSPVNWDRGIPGDCRVTVSYTGRKGRGRQICHFLKYQTHSATMNLVPWHWFAYP